MFRQQFDTVDVLRLEVETNPTGLINLVQNPSGELGGWGWITPILGSALAGDADGLHFTGVAGTSHFTTEEIPISVGQYVSARVTATEGTGITHFRMRFEWLDEARTVLSSATQSPYFSVTEPDAQYLPASAPASTAYVRLRFDLYADGAGAAPAGAHTFSFVRAAVAKAATAAELGQGRTNMVPNPSLETDTTGWVAEASVGSLTRSTAQSWSGAASLLVESSAGGGATYAVSTLPALAGMPVTPGQDYTAQARARAVTAARTAALTARWYDAEGALLSSVAGAALATSTGAWSVHSVTATAPAGAAFMDVAATLSRAADAVEAHYLDAVLVEESPTLGDYFDGDSPDTTEVTYAWATRPPLVRTRTNRCPNPSFETNTAGWSASLGTLARSTTDPWVGSGCLQLKKTATASTGYFTAPVTPGQTYTLSGYVRQGSTAGSMRAILIFKNAAGTNLSSANGSLAAVSPAWGRRSVTAKAPAGATQVLAGFNQPSGSSSGTLGIDGVLLEAADQVGDFFDGSTADSVSDFTTVERSWTGAANASNSTEVITTTLPYSTETTSYLSYIEPVQYFDVLPDSHQIRISRRELNVGRLSATVLSSALDPSQSDLIHPGRRARLTCLVAGSSETIIGGKLLEADVTYELKDPRVPTEKRARIEVVLADPMQLLANAGRPEGVATIDDLPFVLEGAGVPWNVNGSGNQVPTATVTTFNDNAKASDQIALTRDSALGFAWMARVGVLNAWDRDQIPTGSPAVLDEDDYSTIDLSFSTKDAINEIQVTVQSVATDGSTVETVYGPFEDAASIAEWGRYRKEFTVTGLTSAEVETFAADILAANVAPRIRVNSMTLPLHTLSRVEAHALRDLYDEVNAVLDTLGINETLRVTGIDHVIDTEKWLLTLTFSEEGGVAQPTVQPPVQSGARPDVGVIELFAGPVSAIPPTKLRCDGTSYPVADYPHLFAVIGHEFGGSGAFFNVPNFVDHVPIGAGTKALATTGPLGDADLGGATWLAVHFLIRAA